MALFKTLPIRPVVKHESLVPQGIQTTGREGREVGSKEMEGHVLSASHLPSLHRQAIGRLYDEV